MEGLKEIATVLQREKILGFLPELRATELFADLILHVQDEDGKFATSFSCHRYLLAAAGNSYLREILAAAPGHFADVFLPDFSAKEVNDVLDLIYCISSQTLPPANNRFFEGFFIGHHEPFMSIKEPLEIKVEQVEESEDEKMEDIEVPKVDIKKDVSEADLLSEEEEEEADQDFNSDEEADSEDEDKKDKIKRKYGRKWMEPRIKMKPNAKEFLWKCTVCPKEKLRPFHDWLMHIKRDGNLRMGMNTCECCGQDCKERDYLLLHNLNVPCLRNTKLEKSFKCQICPFESFALRSLQNHVFMQHGDKCRAKVPERSEGYACEICFTIIYTVKGFSDHQKKIHGIVPENFQVLYEKSHREYWKRFDPIFQEINDKGMERDSEIKPKEWIYCEPCQKACKQKKAGFYIHVRKHDQFACKICDKLIPTLHDFHDHRRICSGPLRCSRVTCDESFKTRAEIKKHLAEDHAVYNPPPQYEQVFVNGKLKFKCDKCDAKFSSSAAVTRHKHLHKEKNINRKLYCDFEGCNYVTDRPANLYNHKMTHGAYTHFCEICGRGFFKIYNYKRHMMARHPDGSSNILCSICGKVFNNQYSLERHAIAHKEPIYSCDLCGKSFKYDTSVKSHKRFAHSMQKDFVCDYPGCSKAFKTRYHMQRHQKTCHGVYVGPFKKENISDDC